MHHYKSGGLEITIKSRYNLTKAMYLGTSILLLAKYILTSHSPYVLTRGEMGEILVDDQPNAARTAFHYVLMLKCPLNVRLQLPVLGRTRPTS